MAIPSVQELQYEDKRPISLKSTTFEQSLRMVFLRVT
jgi:hypothetical protein